MNNVRNLFLFCFSRINYYTQQELNLLCCLFEVVSPLTRGCSYTTLRLFLKACELFGFMLYTSTLSSFKIQTGQCSVYFLITDIFLSNSPNQKPFFSFFYQQMWDNNLFTKPALSLSQRICYNITQKASSIANSIFFLLKKNFLYFTCGIWILIYPFDLGNRESPLSFLPLFNSGIQ